MGEQTADIWAKSFMIASMILFTLAIWTGREMDIELSLEDRWRSTVITLVLIGMAFALILAGIVRVVTLDSFALR